MQKIIEQLRKRDLNSMYNGESEDPEESATPSPEHEAEEEDPAGPRIPPS